MMFSKRVIIQVEEKWGDSTYFVDIHDRELSGNSVLQVVRLQQVSVLYIIFLIYVYEESQRADFTPTLQVGIANIKHLPVCMRELLALSMHKTRA